MIKGDDTQKKVKEQEIEIVNGAIEYLQNEYNNKSKKNMEFE